MNWDGSGVTPLGGGYALAVWRHPADGLAVLAAVDALEVDRRDRELLARHAERLHGLAHAPVSAVLQSAVIDWSCSRTAAASPPKAEPIADT